MIKVIALFGESACGKNYLKDKLLELKGDVLHNVVTSTTRPPREGEINGETYHFLTEEEFSNKLLADDFIEAISYDTNQGVWMYGTDRASFSKDKINIGIWTPDGIESLKHEKDIELFAYYIEVKPKTRIIRQLQREEDPDIFEIFRRFKTDCEDFCDYQFYYNIVKNENSKDFEETLKIMIEDINQIASI